MNIINNINESGTSNNSTFVVKYGLSNYTGVAPSLEIGCIGDGDFSYLNTRLIESNFCCDGTSIAGGGLGNGSETGEMTGGETGVESGAETGEQTGMPLSLDIVINDMIEDDPSPTGVSNTQSINWDYTRPIVGTLVSSDNGISYQGTLSGNSLDFDLYDVASVVDADRLLVNSGTGKILSQNSGTAFNQRVGNEYGWPDGITNSADSNTSPLYGKLGYLPFIQVGGSTNALFDTNDKPVIYTQASFPNNKFGGFIIKDQTLGWNELDVTTSNTYAYDYFILTGGEKRWPGQYGVMKLNIGGLVNMWSVVTLAAPDQKDVRSAGNHDNAVAYFHMQAHNQNNAGGGVTAGAFYLPGITTEEQGSPHPDNLTLYGERLDNLAYLCAVFSDGQIRMGDGGGFYAVPQVVVGEGNQETWVFEWVNAVNDNPMTDQNIGYSNFQDWVDDGGGTVNFTARLKARKTYDFDLPGTFTLNTNYYNISCTLELVTDLSSF